MNLKFLPQGKLPYLAAAGLIFALIVALNRQGTKQNMPLITPPQSPYNKSIAGIGVIEPKGETINIGVDIPGIVRTINVKVNDQVKKGDILGIQGTTGRSTGAHLHYEVRYNDSPLNPRKFLEAGGGIFGAKEI